MIEEAEILDELSGLDGYASLHIFQSLTFADHISASSRASHHRHTGSVPDAPTMIPLTTTNPIKQMLI